ncbi:MAG: PBSX family phage terminase large subunit [Clostridiales bacterium]|nr:PBSX family phage terminase large subunit [Clostridiales bacterium]
MAEVKIFEQYKPFFRDDYRYNVVYGGRGKGASWNIARGLLAEACQGKHRILCTREFQNSINESVYQVLVEQIGLLGLQANFNVQKSSIVSLTGSEFLFKGLRHNVDSIKSMEGITRVWIAEADKVPHDSLDKLIPTIRTKGSKFYIDFNTDTEDDPVYKQFVLTDRDDTHVIFQTFEDNPFFPDVLRAEMEYDRKYNHEKYLWVWEGKPRSFSESCVFSGKYEIDDFTTPEDAHFMHGADWGFAHDPTVLVRCFEKDGYLYIDQEVYAIGVEIDDHPKLFDNIPTSARWPIVADSARPEVISYMRKRGYKITPARKGKGSIIAGVDRLRNFKKIIVHPRCKHTIEELKLYSYKRNTTTGDVMPILVDEHNHIIDGLRYATEKYRKNVPTTVNLEMGALGL